MTQHPTERIVGTFKGQSPGPLVVVIGALHGNEPAGVRAMELVFDALEQARKDHPPLAFRGKLIGLIGNAQAYLIRQRFLERDLNRVWTDSFLQAATQAPADSLNAESREVREIFELIAPEYQSADNESIVFLDLHTTSAEGGIFSIPTDEGESLRLSQHLGAPAIVGLQESISGTLLGFAKSGGFSAGGSFQNDARLPVCIAFEAGQHESTHATNRSAIAIVRCLRAVGCIDQHALLDFSDKLSLPFLAEVPPVVRLCYAHHISAEDGFKMRPGYVNFQPIKQGEHLADDVHGPVLSPDNGLILMPLYQAKGSDGFFIVQ